jgi:hypothetical protein
VCSSRQLSTRVCVAVAAYAHTNTHTNTTGAIDLRLSSFHQLPILMHAPPASLPAIIKPPSSRALPETCASPGRQAGRCPLTALQYRCSSRALESRGHCALTPQPTPNKESVPSARVATRRDTTVPRMCVSHTTKLKPKPSNRVPQKHSQAKALACTLSTRKGSG